MNDEMTALIAARKRRYADELELTQKVLEEVEDLVKTQDNYIKVYAKLLVRLEGLANAVAIYEDLPRVGYLRQIQV